MKRRSFLGFAGLFAAPVAAVAATSIPAKGRELPARFMDGQTDKTAALLMVNRNDGGESFVLESERFVEMEVNGKRGYVMVFERTQ